MLRRRAGGPSGSAIVGSATVAMRWSLLERLEIGDQLRDLLGREVEVRHTRAGFLTRGVVEPPAEVVGVHLEQATGERLTAVDVREVGADLAAREAGHRVTAAAALGLEQEPALARGRLVARLRGARLLLLGDPARELGRALGDDPQAPVWLGQPAELGALAEIGARLVGLQLELVDAT